MDISEALEGEYLNVKMVQESPSKKCVIIGAGQWTDTEFGRRITLPVQIDGKQKTWRPNRMSLENMSVLGMDTLRWLGVTVDLVVLFVKGKDCVIGNPRKPFEFKASTEAEAIA